jgi:hypothetical protein
MSSARNWSRNSHIPEEEITSRFPPTYTLYRSSLREKIPYERYHDTKGINKVNENQDTPTDRKVFKRSPTTFRWQSRRKSVQRNTNFSIHPRCNKITLMPKTKICIQETENIDRSTDLISMKNEKISDSLTEKSNRILDFPKENGDRMSYRNSIQPSSIYFLPNLLLLKRVPSSSYSCLTGLQLPQVRLFLKRTLPEYLISRVLDATAHIGCDTLNFAFAYPHSVITAIELDSSIFNVLCSNVSIYFPDFNRFHLINGDCVSYFRLALASIHCLDFSNTHYDLVYLDPPWNGKQYINFEKYMLYLSRIPIYIIVKEILQNHISPRVLLKVPRNFHFNKFNDYLEKYNILKVPIFSKGSCKVSYFLLLITI